MVGQQRPINTTQFQQVVTSLLQERARATHLQSQHEPHMVQGDLSHETLKSRKRFLDTRSALTEVFIDDQDTIAMPTKIDGTIGQSIL